MSKSRPIVVESIVYGLAAVVWSPPAKSVFAQIAAPTLRLNAITVKVGAEFEQRSLVSFFSDLKYQRKSVNGRFRLSLK